jgi:hypothetical protein
MEYGKFLDNGKEGEAPYGFKHIHGYMAYDVKHDGCHKARYVA